MPQKRSFESQTESDFTDSEGEYQITSADLREAQSDEIEDLLPVQQKRSSKVNNLP